MKQCAISFLFAIVLRFLAILPAVPQTAPANTTRPRPHRKEGPENLPWTRFHPAAPPYQPTDAEKQQIQAKTDQLGGIIRELRSARVDDALLADVEIYYEAARWKMAYPEEFFRQRTVADTLAVLDKGLERAAQLKEGKSPWTTQKGRVVRGYRSALDDSVQPVRVTVPDEYDGTRAFPLDVAQHGRFTSLYEVETLNSWQGAEIDYLPGTLQIDLFGRGKNTYHWPGEADIFEAIDVRQESLQDRSGRMTLRGFSMGGAGVWHTLSSFPDLWTAVEVGAGDNTSHRIPILDTLPPYSAGDVQDLRQHVRVGAQCVRYSVCLLRRRERPERCQAQQRQEQLIRDGIHFEGDPFSLKATDAPIDDVSDRSQDRARHASGEPEDPERVPVRSHQGWAGRIPTAFGS